jgi:hypothetical protein
VADHYAGLRVIDVSDPTVPVEVGVLDMYREAWDVEVVGDLAYVANGRYRGLRVIDVSDPTAPREIGALAIMGGPSAVGNARAVELVGDLAYVAAGSAGLRVIDVSDPTAPLELGGVGTWAAGIAVVGTVAYVANELGGLAIIDFGPEYHTRVAIDIEPGSAANRINLMRRGFVSVAILGSERFDVADVDAATLAFGPAGAAPVDAAAARTEDTNADGFEDLVLDFRTEEAGIAFGDTQACILGETWDAVPIGGCDVVDVLGPSLPPSASAGCGLGFELVLVLPPLLWWRRARSTHERE